MQCFLNRIKSRVLCSVFKFSFLQYLNHHHLQILFIISLTALLCYLYNTCNTTDLFCVNQFPTQVFNSIIIQLFVQTSHFSCIIFMQTHIFTNVHKQKYVQWSCTLSIKGTYKNMKTLKQFHKDKVYLSPLPSLSSSSSTPPLSLIFLASFSASSAFLFSSLSVSISHGPPR